MLRRTKALIADELPRKGKLTGVSFRSTYKRHIGAVLSCRFNRVCWPLKYIPECLSLTRFANEHFDKRYTYVYKIENRFVAYKI